MEQIKSLRSDNQRLKDTMNESLTRVNQFHDQQLRQARQKLSDLEGELAKAVSLADETAVKALRKEIREVEATPVMKPQQPIQDAPQIQPRVAQWEKDNPWITEDSPKSAYAQTQFAKGMKMHGANARTTEDFDAAIAKTIADVDKVVGEAFPDEDTRQVNHNREAPATVASSRNRAKGGGKNKLTLDDLTKEESAMFQAFGDTYKSQDEFLKAVADSRVGAA